MGGALTLTVPVLDTAVGVRIPTARLAGAVQVVAAVYGWWSCWSDAVDTAGITDWPEDQHHHSSLRQCSAHSPFATVGVLLVVAAACKITDEAGCDSA